MAAVYLWGADGISGGDNMQNSGGFWYWLY